MVGIYKITNLINKKVYIGQSINIEKRFIAHKSVYKNYKAHNYEYPLYRAMRKYGFENFQFEILEECSIKDLDEKEKYYIKYYNSKLPNGYNQDDGGKSARHYNKLSDELVSKIIIRLKTSMDNSEIIGKEFGVSGRTIRAINSGEQCKRDNEIYPIRPPLQSLQSVSKGNKIKKEYEIKKEQRFCLICNKPFYVLKNSTGKYCSQECAHIAQRRAERPDRNKLKQLIRNTSFLQIGKMFNVSDNTIRKWCKNMDLPYKASEIKKYSDYEWELI